MSWQTIAQEKKHVLTRKINMTRFHDIVFFTKHCTMTRQTRHKTVEHRW